MQSLWPVLADGLKARFAKSAGLKAFGQRNCVAVGVGRLSPRWQCSARGAVGLLDGERFAAFPVRLGHFRAVEAVSVYALAFSKSSDS